VRLHFPECSSAIAVDEDVRSDNPMDSRIPVASAYGLGQLSGVGKAEVDDHCSSFWSIEVESS
jgi:hypothetical protein